MLQLDTLVQVSFSSLSPVIARMIKTTWFGWIVRLGRWFADDSRWEVRQWSSTFYGTLG